MKTLVTYILIAAMLFIGPSRSSRETRAVTIPTVCLILAVIIVGGTVIYVVKKSADCATKDRCPNCGAIRKPGDVACPRCLEPYPAQTAQAEGWSPTNPSTNFCSELQYSCDLVNWSTLLPLTNNAPWVYYNPATEIVQLATEAEFCQWLEDNHVLPANVTALECSGGPTFFRYVEIDN